MSDFSISTFESKIAFHIKNLASIDKTEIYVRVDKRFSDSPLANYFVDWIFETRDKALAFIGIAPNTRYTKLCLENPEKD